MLAHGLEDLLIIGAVFNLGGGGLWLNTVKAPLAGCIPQVPTFTPMRN